MSLEQQLSSAIAAQNNLTQTVASSFDNLKAQVNGFINAWGINGYTTLTVGQGKQFANIQDAWNSLTGKVLQAGVLIQVSDGIYNQAGIGLENHPYAHMVRIVGNLVNPTNCVLNFVADANRVSHGIFCNNVRGLEISGFKLVGGFSENNITWRGLYVGNSSWVRSADNSLVIEGGFKGLEVVENSRYYCTGLIVNGFYEWGVLVSSSLVRVNGLKMNGRGRDVETPLPKSVWSNGGVIHSHGIGVVDGAQCLAGGCRVTNCSIGYYSARNCYFWCDSSKADNCGYGFNVEHFSSLWCFFGEASNCYTGWRAHATSNMLALNTRATACRDYGYLAEHSSRIDASGSTAISCGTGYFCHLASFVGAWNTVINLKNNGTNYNPPAGGVLGNSNSQIHFN